jgi:hypothetical protein
MAAMDRERTKPPLVFNNPAGMMHLSDDLYQPLKKMD